MHIIAVEKPVGVVVAFGGGTAIKLTKFLSSQGVRVIGTSADSIQRGMQKLKGGYPADPAYKMSK